VRKLKACNIDFDIVAADENIFRIVFVLKSEVLKWVSLFQFPKI
jgi:hypothetical protein